MIYVVATIRAHPGKRAELLPHAKTVIAETRKEKGCLLYDMHASITDPDVVQVVEQWESREHLGAHFEQAHMKTWRAAGAPLIASRKVEIITPGHIETR